jgi:hypothetical protein
MKSFLVTLLSWAVFYFAIEFFFRRSFYPPGDWIGALLVSFFIAIGIGALRKARIDRRDAALIARPEGPPRGGERVAIAGTIEPVGDTLLAPFSGTQCLAYDYEVTHVQPRRDQHSEVVIDRSGLALVPSVIRSGVRTIKLLAFPSLEGFQSKVKSEALEQAKVFLNATPAEDVSGLRAFASLGEIAELVRDSSGAVRKDWRLTNHDDLDQSALSERVLPIGAKVCVVGRYDAEKNAIVPEANTGGVRLIKGTRDEALQLVRGKKSGDFLSAGFFLIVPALIAFGVLSYRERYDERKGRPSLRGNAITASVAAGDAGAVRAALTKGADPNLCDEDGSPPLTLTENIDIASALLDAGAKIDYAGRREDTPLMVAARFGRADMARLLLRRGAAVNQRSEYYHKTALDIALARGQVEVAEILRKAGAAESK